MWNDLTQRGLEAVWAQPKDRWWRYEVGFFMDALWGAADVLIGPECRAAVRTWRDAVVTSDGNLLGYRPLEYQLDAIEPGRVLIACEKDRLWQSATACAQLLEQLVHQPRTSEGGFWHKAIYPNQMWLDGIYMAGPFLVQQGVRYHQPQWIDEAIRQIALLRQHTRDQASGLWYHGFDESRQQRWANPDSGCSSQFWGRGMGWMMMGLVDVLEMLSRTHQAYSIVQAWFADAASAVQRVQDSTTGLWWQVLDRPDAKGNYFESSASAMFVYALLKGIRLGALDEGFRESAIRGYEGIKTRLIRWDERGAHLAQANAVSGLGGTPYRDGSYAYYVQTPPVMDDLKALAAWIKAGVERRNYGENSPAT
jgi:unsaturated rhamnogalacturonyl hydrolase